MLTFQVLRHYLEHLTQLQFRGKRDFGPKRSVKFIKNKNFQFSSQI